MAKIVDFPGGKTPPTPPRTKRSRTGGKGGGGSEPPKTGGRPTKLSKTLIDEAVRMIEESGCFAITVAKALGVTERTWYNWLDAAERAAGKPPSKRTKNDELYLAFADGMERAEAKVEIKSLTVCRRGDLGWQGSAWYLERRHRDRWGRGAAENDGGQLTDLVNAIGEARKEWAGKKTAKKGA